MRIDKIWLPSLTPLILIGLVFATLSGCASVALAPPEEDLKSKSMQPASDRALVYVFRHAAFGALVSFTLSVDQTAVGPIKNCTYYVLDVAPQKMKLIAESENTAELDVEPQAGQIRYFRLEPRIGVLRARVQITENNKAEAADDIANCSLIKVQKV